MKNSFKYIFTVRGSLEGPYIHNWCLVTENEKEMKATIFLMKMTAKINMASDLLCVILEKETSIQEFESFLHKMNQEQFQKFIKEAAV